MTKSLSKNKFLTNALTFFIYAISGVLTALPLVFTDLWPLGWIAPCGVFYMEFTREAKKESYFLRWLRGFNFFWFYGFIVFSWFLYAYPLDFLGFDRQSALIIVLLASMGIPLLQALFSSFLFVFISFLRRRDFLCKKPILSAVFIAAFWVLSEFANTLTWAGVPWGKLALGQIGCLANVQSASLFGSYFIAFIVILVSGLITIGIIKLKEGEKKKSLLAIFLAFAVFIGNISFGAVRISVLTNENSDKKFTAAAIQGNIKFEDKWDDKVTYTIKQYRSLTLAAAEEGAELIVWPETAIPYDYNETSIIPDFFVSSAKDSGAELIATSFLSDDGDLSVLRNIARLVHPDGTMDDAIYAKRRLVPFGEFIPMQRLIETVFPPLASMSPIEYPLTAGNETAIFESKYGKIGSLICFDSIFESLCLESVRDGAEIIAISTNDSWFTGSPALSQHNSQAALRAIENDRYIIRSANTGISSVISNTGEVLSSLGDSEEGYAIADIEARSTRTLYNIIGNTFVLLCAAYIAGTLAYSLYLFRKEKKEDDHSNNG